MKSFVLDASAVLRFADNEAGADRVQDLIDLAEAKAAKLYMSPMNWGEVVYSLLRHARRATADQLKRALHLTFPAVEENDAAMAGQLKQRTNLAYADCFAASLADGLSATLVTADYDFKSLSSNLDIEFLPKKP